MNLQSLFFKTVLVLTQYSINADILKKKGQMLLSLKKKFKVFFSKIAAISRLL